MSSIGRRGALAALLAMVVAPLGAQQSIPIQNGAPVPPPGLPVPPLPNEPIVYPTAEGMDIRVSVVARGLETPWSLAVLPNGDRLVTERNAGRLRLSRDGALVPAPVAGVPEVRGVGLSGLMDVVLHPRFDETRFVYLSYNKPFGEQAGLAVARGRWNGQALTDVRDIFETRDAGSISRLAFGADGMLYVTTFGGTGDAAQDPSSLAGKVLRLRDDGSVPPDNPFVGRSGYRPEIFTMGHRSPLGLALHPASGQLWEVEMGPNGGDELNVLKPGANYGWPVVSYGRTYPGPWQSEKGSTHEGYEAPTVYWMPSISTSGLAFYTGNRLPKWKGDVFVGGMRYGEIPGTGRLERVLFNENMEELRRESLLIDLRHRIRDVRQGPDELLYLVTDHAIDGAVLRIEPAS